MSTPETWTGPFKVLGVREPPQVLAAALLWLRNHYDLAPPARGSECLKRAVLGRIDQILDAHAPTGVELQLMRDAYPIPEQPYSSVGPCPKGDECRWPDCLSSPAEGASRKGLNPKR
jgi:hypothetical protein